MTMIYLFFLTICSAPVFAAVSTTPHYMPNMQMNESLLRNVLRTELKYVQEKQRAYKNISDRYKRQLEATIERLLDISDARKLRQAIIDGVRSTAPQRGKKASIVHRFFASLQAAETQI